jgi:chromosome segregation ATPase
MEVEKGQKAQIELLEDRKNLLDRVKDLNDRIETIQKDNSKADITRADLERDHSELLIKYKAMSLFKEQNEQLKRELLDCERKRAELTDLYARRYQELEHGLDEVTRRRDALQKENNRLMKEISDSTAQLVHERNLNTELQNEANNIKKKLQLTQATIEISEGIQKQRDDLMRELGNLKSHYAHAVEGLENYKNEILSKHKDMDAIDRSNKAEIQTLRHNITQLQGRIDELNNNKIRLEREAIELRAQNVTLEQMLVLREDTVAQVNAANDEVYQVRTEIDNLKANLNSSASLIEAHNDKIYELEKVVIYLKNVVNEKEEYINNLRRVIVELKTKSAVYVPVHDDPLDKRLGEFINTCNDPAKVSQLFLRESDGVYQFGSKRVAVKCENDKVFSTLFFS